MNSLLIYLVLCSAPIAVILFMLEEGINPMNELHFETKYHIHKAIDNVFYPFRKLWYTIRNFFYWGYKLKDDRNWDFYYLYYILTLKLKLMRESLAAGFVERNELKKILKPLDRAIALAERLRDQDYSRNMDKHEQKYGKLHLTFNPTNNPRLSSGYFWNENCLNPKEQKKADKAHLKANIKDAKEEDDDRKELFRIIAKNINKWWD